MADVSAGTFIPVAASAPRIHRGLARWAPLTLLLPVIILLLWWLAAYFELGSPQLLVSPQTVFLAAFTDPAGSSVWLSAVQSLARLASGFAIGASAGLAVGLLTGLASLADRSLSPTLAALRQITLFAWIPLLTGWFGNGEVTRQIYIALTAFFPVALCAHDAFRRIPLAWLEAASVLRLKPLTRLRRLVLPAALPGICTGLQIGLVGAWLGTISSEYAIGISDGLGGLIVLGRQQFRMDIVLLGVTALTLVGYGIGAAASRTRSYLLRHHGLSK
ncbi:ABC transporter permease [Aureimonas fodinaquatilis]|nr:ABC transporter permease subunit [Aureimonas fodinaquatilis]